MCAFVSPQKNTRPSGHGVLLRYCLEETSTSAFPNDVMIALITMTTPGLELQRPHSFLWSIYYALLVGNKHNHIKEYPIYSKGWTSERSSNWF